jgi:hypothetical protein
MKVTQLKVTQLKVIEQPDSRTLLTPRRETIAGDPRQLLVECN